jgi:cyclase
MTEMNVRIIPRLDIKGPNLVKGIHLEGLRVLGKPENFARYYYEQGADELLYMDIVASLYQRNSLLEVVKRTSREIFIPLTVGGGLRSLDDIREALRCGADKVSLNTAAIRQPELISEAARRFGSSTIVVSIEAKRMPDGKYEAYVDNGRERTGVEVFGWAKRVAELGAGEIMITSIDQEGTGKGFDLELTQRVAQSVPIPVIACGGAGNVNHVSEVITDGMADAVSVASLLHYNFIKPKSISEGNGSTAYANGKTLSARSSSNINDLSLIDLKKRLTEHGISCRSSEAVKPYAESPENACCCS